MSGTCACSDHIFQDNNTCTEDACVGSNCTHRVAVDTTSHPNISCANPLCVGKCTALGCECPKVAPAPEGSPLRIGTFNAAALPKFTDAAQTIGSGILSGGVYWTPGGDAIIGSQECPLDMFGIPDYECRANEFAAKILASNYDIIAVNEAFDDTFKDALFNALHGTVAEGKFPYGISDADRYDSDNILSPDAYYQESGLMLFSKWPIDVSPTNAEDCFQDKGLVEASYSTGFPALGFESFGGGKSEEAADALSNKGVGWARVVSPGGLRYDVFLSHTQASYGASDDEAFLDDSVRPRQAQFKRIAHLMGCLKGKSPAPVAQLLIGDLNVGGDLSSPFVNYWAHPAGPPCKEHAQERANLPVCLPGQLQAYQETVDEFAELRGNGRTEWDIYFGSGTVKGLSTNIDPTLTYFKTDVKDTWAYAMSPRACSGVAFGAAPVYVKDDNLRRCGVTPDVSVVQGTKGTANYDRGFTWAKQSSEDRLDYVLLGSTGTRSDDKMFGYFGPQHVTNAYNLLSGSAGKGGLTWIPKGTEQAPAGYPNGLVGTSNQSDHIGLNAEINIATPHSTPATSFVLPEVAPGKTSMVPMRLENRGVVQWIRVDDPGTYSFSVNPATQVPKSDGNGIVMEVYAATELSKPLAPYKNEIRTVPAGQTRVNYGVPEFPFWVVELTPGLQSAKYNLVEGPYYLKIYHPSAVYSPTYTGEYLLLASRSACASVADACDIVPFKSTDLLMPAGTSDGATEAWFSFWVDQPDVLTGKDASNQQLAIDVTINMGAKADPAKASQAAVSLHDAAGKAILDANRNPIVLKYTNGVWKLSDADGSLQKRADYRHGTKFLLKVQHLDGAVPLSVSVYERTKLTWYYSSDLGGESAVLHCSDTQEVGDDEIWLSFSSDGVRRYEISGGIDEGETASLTDSALRGWAAYQGGPAAVRFTDKLFFYLIEDDAEYDEIREAGIDSSALGDKPGPVSAPGMGWTFPDSIDDGEYDAYGGTLAHYLEARTCVLNTMLPECGELMRCNGQICVEKGPE